MKKTVQYFSDEYLEYCKKMTPAQIFQFLEDFRNLHGQASSPKIKTKLISIKIPEDMLSTFKQLAKSEGKPYQTLIKILMKDWITTQSQSKSEP